MLAHPSYKMKKACFPLFQAYRIIKTSNKTSASGRPSEKLRAAKLITKLNNFKTNSRIAHTVSKSIPTSTLSLALAVGQPESHHSRILPAKKAPAPAHNAQFVVNNDLSS